MQYEVSLDKFLGNIDLIGAFYTTKILHTIDFTESLTCNTSHIKI